MQYLKYTEHFISKAPAAVS